jgi:hypothetical protein
MLGGEGGEGGILGWMGLQPSLPPPPPHYYNSAYICEARAAQALHLVVNMACIPPYLYLLLSSSLTCCTELFLPFTCTCSLSLPNSTFTCACSYHLFPLKVPVFCLDCAYLYMPFSRSSAGTCSPGVPNPTFTCPHSLCSCHLPLHVLVPVLYMYLKSSIP